MLEFRSVLFTIFYIFVTNTFVSTRDCNSLPTCKCLNVTFTSKLVCYLEDQDSFDFQKANLKNLSHVEVHGKTILMKPVSPPELYTNVRTLYLEGHEEESEVLHSFLIQFPNIQNLHIKNCNIITIETGAFHGLSLLETLDLSGNGNLAYEYVEAGLVGLNSPQLRLLNLSLIHNPVGVDTLPVGRLSYNMFKSLANTSLEVLDVSWSRLYFFEGSARNIPNLRSLNCSGTALIGTCMTTLLTLKNITEVVFDFWPNVERSAVLQAYPKPRYKLDVSDICDSVPLVTSDGCYFFPNSLRTLQAQYLRLSSFYIDVTKGVCLLSKGLINFIVPGIALSNSFVSLVGFENIELIDISYPNYVSTEVYFPAISSKFIHSMPVLKIILIPGNRLDAFSVTDLEQLLSISTHLELLDISNNGLQQIPRKMFGNNMNLKHLNISRNELTSFVPDSTTVLNLKVLDLSFNKISYLDGTFLARINLNNNLNVFNIDISYNLLPCDCNINNLLSSNISNLGMTCYDITNGMHIIYGNETVQYPCQTTADHNGNLLLLLIIIPFIVVLFVVVCIIVIRRRRRLLAKSPPRHEPAVHFVKAVDVTTQRNPEFLSFIAYSHIDSDFVCLELVPKLDKSLRKLFPDNKGDILCLYDKHFIPGQGTDEACEQAVLNCYVIVAIITKAFLNSSWCDFEIKRAFMNRVPVIPLYLVDCNPTEYKGIFRMMFEDRTRMKWPSFDSSTNEISKGTDSNKISKQQRQKDGCVRNLAEKKDAAIDNLAVAIYSHVQIQMH